jgi:CheY-like chemotaxis protein
VTEVRRGIPDLGDASPPRRVDESWPGADAIDVTSVLRRRPVLSTLGGGLVLIAVEDVVDEAQVDGGGSETVLLVEDEPIVRQLVQEMLEAEGYEVVAAASPLEAIAIADAGTSPDVVLTDVTMPGMNGLQLAGELQQRQPSLRVVFTSGYAVDVADEIGSAPFLQKPFSSAALSQTVRAALDG